MTVIKPASADPGDGTAHLVVWVDHRSARIYALTRGAVHETAVRNSAANRCRRQKSWRLNRWIVSAMARY